VRLSVLDAGSHAVSHVIADVEPGGVPTIVASAKHPLRLGQRISRSGVLDSAAVRDLVIAVRRAAHVSDRHHCDDFYAMGTAIIREAPNANRIVRVIHRQTGVKLHFLPGEEEARLTFAAVRRWLGVPTAQIVLLDIGGSTTEVAWGTKVEPSLAVSLPLGAARLTRLWLPGMQPSSRSVRRLTAYIDEQLDLSVAHPAVANAAYPVAASRTFQQLAELCRARPDVKGRVWLKASDLRRWVPRLAEMTPSRRAKLPGISRARAHQSLAGAIVADRLMRAFKLDAIAVSPVGLREGIMLERAER